MPSICVTLLGSSGAPQGTRRKRVYQLSALYRRYTVFVPCKSDPLGNVYPRLFAETNVIDPIFPPWILYISIINLLVGNGMLIFMNIIAVWRRELYNLTPWALLNPLYWIFHSIAAWKAQLQIIRKPFYWEKTPYGISKNFKEGKVY